MKLYRLQYKFDGYRFIELEVIGRNGPEYKCQVEGQAAPVWVHRGTLQDDEGRQYCANRQEALAAEVNSVLAQTSELSERLDRLIELQVTEITGQPPGD